MADKIFTIYRSSAGSGKTRTLAKEYLKLALKYRAGYFKHILAVTFTNKATQEMKERIIQYLNDFIENKNQSLANELKTELQLDDQTFLLNCHELRMEILHNYSQFSISTIDAFFQKVIRSFTREAGLAGDYRLEADQDAVLEDVVRSLMDELGRNKSLTKWMIDFALANLESDKPWDVRNGLMEFGNELFRDEFMAIEDEFSKVTSRKNFFTNFLKQAKKEQKQFLDFIHSKANEALSIINDHGLSVQDFKWAGSGPSNWLAKVTRFGKIKDFTEKEVGSRPTKDYQQPGNWPNAKSKDFKLILELAKDKLIPLMNEILTHRSENYTAALSAEVVLDNFYAFGLISDISRKLKEYKAEQNLMLLADAPKFLNHVIGDSDTPFIYEKVGSWFKHYLIDEFQDTSRMQWENFFPLVTEGLDSGNKSFVVGDVKQAIYRWRGGNLKLLQQEIEQQVGPARVGVEKLSNNFRSAEHIVSFNNALFQSAASIVELDTSDSFSVEAYQDVNQSNKKPDKGIVHIQFVQNTDTANWTDIAMDLLVNQLEQLQSAGISMKDVAILVRRNDEGQQIVSHLLNYKNSEKAHRDYNYEVISNESLRLDGAASVNLLLGAMRYLHNPLDVIARAELVYEYAKIHRTDLPLTDVFAVAIQSVFESYLPNEFTGKKFELKKLPLFELTETLIQLFNLGSLVGEIAYLSAFQDLVLNFYARERNDIEAFLEWWEENKSTDKASLKTSGDIDAAQIITIHKAKGLQFNYVIIPFCSWEMDHAAWKAPNLWVKSDQGIFKDAGYVPVKYRSALENTYFAEYYSQEKTQCHLDNLNLLYVAFTRAEQGLFVIAPKNMKSTVSGLVFQSIQNNISLLKSWFDQSNEFKLGELRVPKRKEKKVENVISLESYPASRWRDKLVIRQAGKTFFDYGEGQDSRVKFGIHVHALLSRIEYQDVVEEAFNQAIADGLLPSTDGEEVKRQLVELMSDKQISSWFDRGWQVKTEVPILLPGGEESRVDRLLLNKKHAVVIDYKTGVPSRTDVKQVQGYMEILHKMNFTEVEGFVLYIRTGEVVNVKSGSAKKVKRKNENQLDLGL